MKKIITTVMALTLALGMSVTAIAAPSPSKTEVSDSTNQTKVEILPGAPADVDNAKIQDALNKLTDEENGWDVDGTKTVSDTEKEAAQKAAMAVVADSANKNVAVISSGDVKVPEDVKELVNKGYIAVTLTFTVPEVKAGDSIVALVFHDGKWDPMNTVVNADGSVSVRFTHFSPVAFVKVTAKAPTYDGWAGVPAADKAKLMGLTQAGTTSPKTGDAGVLGFALVAVACGAALVFTKKKFA